MGKIDVCKTSTTGKHPTSVALTVTLLPARGHSKSVRVLRWSAMLHLSHISKHTYAIVCAIRCFRFGCHFPLWKSENKLQISENIQPRLSAYHLLLRLSSVSSVVIAAAVVVDRRYHLLSRTTSVCLPA